MNEGEQQMNTHASGLDLLHVLGSNDKSKTSKQHLQGQLDAAQVTYCESDLLTNVRGFLMVYGSQRLITMSTQCSPEEKARGLQYLVDCLVESVGRKRAVYLWMGDETHNNQLN